MYPKEQTEHKVLIVYENHKMGINTRRTKGKIVNQTPTQIFIEKDNGCLEIISFSNIVIMHEVV